MAYMISKYISPGSKVDISTILTGKKEGEKKKTYSSKVFDVVDEDEIEVTMPMEQTKLILLPVNAVYEAYFYGDNGLYEAKVRIKDRYKSNNIYILLLELESNLRKYQRREFYRYSCALQMQSRVLEEKELEEVEKDIENNPEDLSPETPLRKSVVVDISGGGLRFIADYQYPTDSTILCKYELLVKGERRQLEMMGRVISSKPIEKRPGAFEHRVQYVNIEKDVQEDIIRYIFDEERKNLRLGKGSKDGKRK